MTPQKTPSPRKSTCSLAYCLLTDTNSANRTVGAGYGTAHKSVIGPFSIPTGTVRICLGSVSPALTVPKPAFVHFGIDKSCPALTVKPAIEKLALKMSIGTGSIGNAIAIVCSVGISSDSLSCSPAVEKLAFIARLYDSHAATVGKLDPMPSVEANHRSPSVRPSPATVALIKERPGGRIPGAQRTALGIVESTVYVYRKICEGLEPDVAIYVLCASQVAVELLDH